MNGPKPRCASAALRCYGEEAHYANAVTYGGGAGNRARGRR